MSDDRRREDYHPKDPNADPLRERLPDEVYAAEADWVRVAMKTMTARRMIGWLRAFAEYSEAAGHDKSAEHAWNVSNMLAHEVEPESVEYRYRDIGGNDD